MGKIRHRSTPRAEGKAWYGEELGFGPLGSGRGERVSTLKSGEESQVRIGSWTLEFFVVVFGRGLVSILDKEID